MTTSARAAWFSLAGNPAISGCQALRPEALRPRLTAGLPLQADILVTRSFRANTHLPPPWDTAFFTHLQASSVSDNVKDGLSAPADATLEVSSRRNERANSSNQIGIWSPAQLRRAQPAQAPRPAVLGAKKRQARTARVARKLSDSRRGRTSERVRANADLIRHRTSHRRRRRSPGTRNSPHPA